MAHRKRNFEKTIERRDSKAFEKQGHVKHCRGTGEVTSTTALRTRSGNASPQSDEAPMSGLTNIIEFKQVS